MGAKDDEEFVQLMDVIDCMPPGLYEMVIWPRPGDMQAGGFVTGDWLARFEARPFDDLRALGRNSPADDRAFAAVARLSELNLSVYRGMMQPLVRALANHPAAELTKKLDPLRLSYTMFTDRNPWMTGVRKLAASVAAARKPISADNPFLAMQAKISDRIISSLEAYRARRDRMAEQMFFGIYGAPMVQKLLGINEDTDVRPAPVTSPAERETQKTRADAYAGMLRTGGFDEALTRAVLYVFAAEQAVDQRCALALNGARQHLLQLSLAAFKVLVRNQFSVLQLEGERAIEALALMVPEAEARAALLEHVRAIAGVGDPPGAGARNRLDRLAKLLAVTAEKRVPSTLTGRVTGSRATVLAETGLH